MNWGWPDVLRAWGELRPPQGWKVAQATVEEIVILPPEETVHSGVLSLVVKQFWGAPECGTFTVGHAFPATLDEFGIYRPDLFVMAVEAMRGMRSSAPMADFLLMAEITTPESAVNDRTKKWRAYARGGIPQYLLIDAYDPGGPTVTLFTQPEKGCYQNAERVSFGGRIALRAPVSAVIDTTDFPFPD